MFYILVEYLEAAVEENSPKINSETKRLKIGKKKKENTFSYLTNKAQGKLRGKEVGKK